MSAINYHKKKFKIVSNSENGELSPNLIFTYEQRDNILSCCYFGGSVILGTILGVVHEDGVLEFSYQQINSENELKTGKCRSIPEVLEDGRIRLYEKWQWTNGDLSSGESILEEI